MNNVLSPLSPLNDPWEALNSIKEFGKHTLTSVEMTVTNLCNMRCEHCAVGDTLVIKEPTKIPLDLMLKRLDEVKNLKTISITGGEPTFAKSNVEDYIVPLLKYARNRGIHSQINSNLTLPYERYSEIVKYLDVMHISFNYLNAEDFHKVGFAKAGHDVPYQAAERLYNQMVENTKRMAETKVLVSAESMINFRTHEKIVDIHKLIIEMGCLRHEVHPMYPSSFAKDLPVISKDQMRYAINNLLDHRNQEVWMLFGTLPFYHCSENIEERRLLTRLAQEKNVTVRNDPDGRNRVNVNLFTGDVFVTDFADISSFGNIVNQDLDSIFNEWLQGELAQSVNCHCPAVSCCGPNLLVKDMYYKDDNFLLKRAILDK